MKQIYKLLLTVVMVVTALVAYSENFSLGDLTYSTGYQYDSWKGVYVTGLTAEGKTKSALSIPSAVTYNGYKYRVIAIAENAFKNQTNIESVWIRYSLQHIDNYAFQGCTNLNTVRLPSSVDWIDDYAFSGCTSLKYVYYAGFSYPIDVSDVAFPNNANMHLYISPLSTPTTDDYKTRKGWTRFTYVSTSKYANDFSMPDAGMYAVGEKDDLDASTVRGLTLVAYNNNSNQSQNGTYFKADRNTADWYGMNYKVVKIGRRAFADETTLKTVDLSLLDDLTYFDRNAFSGCSAVTKLVLPKSNFTFHVSAFNGLSSLTAFEIPDGSARKVYNGCLYSASYQWLMRVPEGKTGEMTYHPDTKAIDVYSHYNCKKITSAMLPYGVTTIEDQAFYGTSGLQSVKIPSSVTFLDSYYVFQGTNPNLYIYCNMATPPTITSGYFGTYGDNSGMKLFVPYGKEDTYSDAGWTGFASVNENGKQAFDLGSVSTLAYTVIKPESTTINGQAYDGCAKLVCQGYTASNSSTSINVPADISYNGKKYAVTGIGAASFRNHSSYFTVTGCLNVDSIYPCAFQNQPVTSYPFTHNLKFIGNYAFDATNLSGTLAIPYGVKLIGSKAFANGKYERIIIPSTCSHYGNFAYNTTTLKELVYNHAGHYNYSGWNLTNVPSTCYIRVPVGSVNDYRQGTLKDRANYITSGAYDFAMNNNYIGNYMVTIISTTPVTYNGTTYAGKAKFVHTPNVTGRSFGGWPDVVTDKTVSTDERAYLITQIGDSLLVGSKVDRINIPVAVTHIGDYAYCGISQLVTNNLELPVGLSYIGAGAFYGTNLKGEIKIPSTVTYIGAGAFSFMGSLTSLYFSGSKPSTLGDDAWTPNGTNPDLNVWVPNQYANQYLTAANSWGEPWSRQLSVWFKPYAESVPFSSVIPTNLSGSGVNAYIATAYDKSNPTQQLTLTKVNQASANTGLLLTDLTANQECRIKHPSGSVSAPATNYLVATPTTGVRVDQQTVGYYWSNIETPHFVKATSAYTSTAGQAYLKLSSTQAEGKDNVYTNLWPTVITLKRGDLNGDDVVDVTDVSIMIDLVLGKTVTLAEGAQPDLDGNNEVDVTDVSILIDIVLGKD